MRAAISRMAVAVGGRADTGQSFVADILVQVLSGKRKSRIIGIR
jgi:hypothetical protein